MTLDEVKRQNTGELWPPIHEVVFDCDRAVLRAPDLVEILDDQVRRLRQFHEGRQRLDEQLVAAASLQPILEPVAAFDRERRLPPKRRLTQSFGQVVRRHTRRVDHPPPCAARVLGQRRDGPGVRPGAR